MTSRRAFVKGLSVALFAGVPESHAQQARRVHRIGYLSSSTGPSENSRTIEERLRELGWIEGQNVVIERRFVGPHRERLIMAVTELVNLRPDLILTGGGAETPQIAMSATSTIPIVFAMADDPVRTGLVRNLSRPESNVTGVFSMNAELDGKRLELLREIMPDLKRVGVMWSPIDPSGAAVMSAAEGASRSLKLQLEPLPIRRAEDLAEAFTDARKRVVEAIAILGTPILFVHQRRMGELASSTRIPAISSWRQLAEAGGLVSYGTNLREMFRRVGDIVDKLLKGAQPAAVPVERPTKFELVINLAAARSLRLAIPQSLLLRADRVLE